MHRDEFLKHDGFEPALPRAGRWPLEGGEAPLPCLCDDAHYGGDDCRVYVVVDDRDDPGVLSPHLDSTGPPANHWLSYEFDCVGEHDGALGFHEDDAERFLLENGIAPGQRFLVHLRYWSTRDYWGEYDCGVEVEGVLWRGRLPDADAATAWEALAARRGAAAFAGLPCAP